MGKARYTVEQIIVSMHGSRGKMNAPRAFEQHTEKCYNLTMQSIGNLADSRLLLTLALVQKPGAGQRDKLQFSRFRQKISHC